MFIVGITDACEKGLLDFIRLPAGSPPRRTKSQALPWMAQVRCRTAGRVGFAGGRARKRTHRRTTLRPHGPVLATRFQMTRPVETLRQSPSLMPHSDCHA